MTRLIALMAIVFIAFGCKNRPKTQDAEQLRSDTLKSITAQVDEPKQMVDTTTTATPVTDNETVEVEPNYWDAINFEKYAVEEEKNFTKAPLNWQDYPEAKDFKTRITEAYDRDEVDFAGHYILATFGCGASCIMGFMMDVQDGKIYDLPLGEENSCLFAEDRVVCKSTSRLFVAGICKEKMDDEAVYYKSYLWDEEEKEFKTIDAKEFLKKQ